MSDKSASLRSPLRRVRHLGAAHAGTTHLWHMRVTSLALLPLTIAFVILMFIVVGKPYTAARQTMSHPLPALIMLLFVETGIYHMMLGMRTIIEDYVHGEHAKAFSLIANICFCAVVGLACAYAILRLSFI